MMRSGAIRTVGLLSQIPEVHYPELVCMSLNSITCAMEKHWG